MIMGCKTNKNHFILIMNDTLQIIFNNKKKDIRSLNKWHVEKYRNCKILVFRHDICHSWDHFERVETKGLQTQNNIFMT